VAHPPPCVKNEFHPNSKDFAFIGDGVSNLDGYKKKYLTQVEFSVTVSVTNLLLLL